MVVSLKQLGEQARVDKRYDEARRILEQVVLTEPNNIDGWGELYSFVKSDPEKLYCVRQISRHISPARLKAAQRVEKKDKDCADALRKGLKLRRAVEIHPQLTSALTGIKAWLITALIDDPSGQPIANGTLVTFHTNKGRLSTDKVTTLNGVVQAILFPDFDTGEATVTVDCGGQTDSIKVSLPTNPPYTAKVSASPSIIPVGGAKSTITAVMLDQEGHLVADGTTVTFSATGGKLVATTDAIAGGKVQAKVTSGNQAGKAVVSAHIDGRSGAVDVTISPGPPHKVRVSATPNKIRVGGEKSTIKALVTDQYGNPVADGINVSFSTAQGGGTFSPSTVATSGGTGEARTELTSDNQPGQVTVVAQANGVPGSVDVAISPGPPHKVRVSATPDRIRVGGEKSTIKALVTDEYDNPVADGIDVVFSTTQGTLSQGVVTISGGAGEAQTELTSDNQPGQVVVSAQANGVPRSVAVTFSPGPPHRVQISAHPDRVLIGGHRSTITASVTDQYGNPVADGTVVRFSTTRGCLYPTMVPTSGGRASTTFTSDQDAGQATVTANADGGSGHVVSDSVRIAVSLPDRLVRCLVCDHLVLGARCPMCGADNERWRELRHGAEDAPWRGFDQVLQSLERFPLWFLIVFALVFVAEVLALIVGFVLFPAGLSRFLWPAAILSLLSCAAIVVIFFALRWALRRHELLRQVKSKKRRLSLITMAALSFGLSAILSVGVAFLLWLVLTYSPQGTWTLKVRNLETDGSRNLLEGQGTIARPIWSPDGHTMAFASDLDGDWDIYVLNADGTEQRNLTDNDAADFAPSWSRDGKQIVFASDREGKWDIFVMDADGQHPRQLVAESDRASDPAWSPAGQEIAYVLSSYVFSLLLGDRVEMAGRFPVFSAVFYAGFFPFLTLALMLVGVRLFVNRLDDEFPRPIFLNTDLLTQIVLESVREHLRLHIDDAGTLVEPALLPIEMDAHELSRVTGLVIHEIERRLGIPVDLRGGLVLRSVGGRRGGGLGFLFERRDEPHWYWVESDEHGRISVLEEYPRVERMQLISASRTEAGGLKMTVSRLVESEKKDKKVGEYPFVFEKRRYEIEANEWGCISSLKEQD